MIPSKSLEERIGAVRSSLENLSDFHANILKAAATLSLCLSHGDLSGPGKLPLWVQLLSSSSGLRQVSDDWIEASDALLRFLGYEPFATAAARSVIEAELALKLGQYGLAAKLNTSPKDAVIKARILVHLDPGTESIPDVLKSLPREGLIRAGVVASYLVERQKKNLPLDAGFRGELEEVASTNNFTAGNGEHREFLRKIHILNSLNLLDIREGFPDKVRKRLARIKDLVEFYPESETKAHVQGNWFFHLSILAKMENNQDLELMNLLSADRIDFGFNVYKYRIAQILHDRGDQQAKGYYEESLRHSPLPMPLVNDYGCFLNDSGMDEEMKSWSELAFAIFPKEEESGE